MLGPIRGLVGGEPVDIGGPTQRRLLASLVAQPDEVVPIASLLDHLWGDDSPPSGPASIQSYVSRLRRALGASVIETVAPGYRLGVEGLSIDSSLFFEIASTLPAEPGPRIEAIETALRLWTGPPFEDFDHVDFAARRLYEVRYDLEEERARLLAGIGRNSEAVAAMERITAVEPLRESAWATLGIVLAGMGRQADAVRALDRYRSKLADIGLEPGPEFSAAESEVFETRPAAPIPRAPMIRAGTSFVGRAHEVAELRRLLEENRLVSVVGPGGMGKTRVAIEVAGEWAATPVAFVRLESLRDDREVAPTVLNAIGGETRGDPSESVVAQLSRGQRRLLVLDNVEHVIEATAALVSELVTSTETIVLVTSREPLNTPGERILSLGPLDPESAIELFRVRARGIDPDFEASAATLDMLCEELDYMPLAIEMAAARTKALAAEDILTRLSRRFGLLDRPLRGAAERHRSLDALVDWSYSLLDPPGQRVFERLSVVAGTFDVDLATAVAGFGDVPADQVAGLLANLVERSLVARTSTGVFRMLRVLKSFAEQQLASGGDESEARMIHSRWFGSLAADIGEGLSTPEETEWISRANDAVEDLAQALAWATETDDLETAQGILEGLFDWFYHRQPPAIIGFGDMVLAKARGHDVYAVACAWAALAALKRGDVELAEELAETGTQVDGAASRFAWFMTGEIASHQQRLPEALDAYRKQRIRASNLRDRIGVIDSTAGEALALAYQGEYPQALEVAGDLGRIAAEVGAPTYRAYADYAMAVSVADTDFRRARELFEDSSRRAESVNNQFIVALAKSALGSLLSRRDPGVEATQLLHDAMDIWENMGLPAYQWAIVQYLAGIIAEGGDVETAGLLLAAASHAGRLGLGPGQRHWAEVTRLLESDERWEAWSSAAESLDLAKAVDMALTSTQPHH